jgi:uncharacterized protein YndB with AHSA1/START domain
VPTTRRSRTVAASPERLWETVGDAHHLPRWWPRVQRVEGVAGKQFTEVLATDSGKAIRADFRVVESRAPELRAWEQELSGSPFERILWQARTEVHLAREPAGTRVTLVARHRMRGAARFGGFMVRRATRKILDEALRTLESLHGA